MKLGILFDLDGTLLDSLEDLMDSVNYILSQYGAPTRTLDEIRTFVGNGARRLISLSLPENTDENTITAALKDYQAYYATHSQIKTKPYRGVIAALSKLAETYPIAIVSNKPDVAVKSLCADYFPNIYALGEAAGCPRKPAPDMVFKAMEVLDIEGCVYVGDSEVDVLTAANANVPCLSVLWGFRDEATIREAGGRFFCSDADEMPKMLEQILGDFYGK